LNFLRCYSSAKREGKIVLMFTKHHSIEGCGGLGTVPRTRVLSLCTGWRLGSASCDGRFTSLRKTHSTSLTLASVILITRLCGPTSRSGGSNRSLSYINDWNIWRTI